MQPLSLPAFRPVRRQRAAGQRGLSIVELLVGVAVGLFVVAAAAMLTAVQLGENRKLMLEAQLQQDLRATADLVSRELRRSGSTVLADQFVWISDTSPSQPQGAMITVTPTAAPDTQAQFSYTRANVTAGQLGFKLIDGKVQTLITRPAGFQDLTDINTMRVTNFLVTPRHVDEPTPAAPEPQRIPCPNLCPDPAGPNMNCWPLLRVREFQVDITGVSTTDAAIQRSIRSIVRLRNDELRIFGGSICPA